MARQRSEINGMTCEHCALKVEAALEDAGATGVFVDYRRGFAEFDDSDVDREQAREAVTRADTNSVSRFRSTATASPSRLPR